MTNQENLLAEIQAKVKPGIKPSQLKRSYSTSDLTKVWEKNEQEQLLTQLTALQQQLSGKAQELKTAQQTVTQLNAELDQYLEKYWTAFKKDAQSQVQLKKLVQRVKILRQQLNNPAFGSPAWANQMINRTLWVSVLLTLLTLLVQWLLA